MTQEEVMPAAVSTGDRAGHTPVAGGCCSRSEAPIALAAPVADSQPCCGTAQEAADAGSCCGPAAKVTAVSAGIGCCG
jgi:hypothetical protein